MRSKTSGSALLMTLLFLSILGILAQRLVQSAFLATRALNDQINTTEAQILALNGLTLACAQLDFHPPATKKLPPEDLKKMSLLKLLAHLNRWQIFPLTNEMDGTNGTIKICISCEEGKIPLNDIIDLKGKTPNKSYAPLFKTLQDATGKKNSNITAQITNYLLKRGTPLEDPTQLNLALPHEIFYNPIQLSPSKKQGLPPPEFPWLDVFSSWNGTGKINPLFFSSSICTLLRLKNPFQRPRDDKGEKDLYPRIAESISKEWGSDWKKNWTILSPLYGAEPQMPAEITALLSEAVEPSVFSVLSCGVVRGVEQRLYAIVHKKKTSLPQQPANSEQEASQAPNVQSQRATNQTCLSPDATCGIVRMYWVDTIKNNDYQTVGLRA